MHEPIVCQRCPEGETKVTPGEVIELFEQYFCSNAKLEQWWPKGLAKNQARPFYRRFFSPLIVLWYLVFQRLCADKTLERAVADARSGGADRLLQAVAKEKKRGRTKAFARLRSESTSAYSQARSALPLEVVRQAFVFLSRAISSLWDQGLERSRATSEDKTRGGAARRLALLDGSTIAMRPFGNIAEQFGPAANQHKQSAYWCLMRIVVSFCAASGAVLDAACAPTKESETALSWELLANAVRGTIFIGDRNFGIYSLVERACAFGHDVVLRLTESRAKRLLGQRKLEAQELAIEWVPTRRDTLAEGAQSRPIAGRLICVELSRKGFRPISLWLFTTLLDRELYLLAELVRWYGLRWHAELNLRYLKTQLGMNKLEAKSSQMAYKEFYAGLIAYNLVRLFMHTAALNAGTSALKLSFSKCARVLVCALQQWARQTSAICTSLPIEQIKELLDRLAKCQLPKRKKPRPNEPRRTRRKTQSFPTLFGDRHAARSSLPQPSPIS